MVDQVTSYKREATQPSPTDPPPQGSARAAGAFLGGKPNAAMLDDFAADTGRMPASVLWFQPWSAPYDPTPVNAAHSKGVTPVLTWLPRDPNAPLTDYALYKITRGDFNDYIQGFAQDVAAHGQPLTIRLAHEQNGDWGTPWSYGKPNHNTPAEYRDFWRHVVDIFRAEGATNAKWFYCPGLLNQGDFRPSYPGDEWVDIVGNDGYNWGDARSWSNWRSFTDTHAETYVAITALSDKPYVIGETASAPSGGDKAAWVTSAYLTEIPQRFPKVRGVIWFNQDKETDWRVQSSAASLDAYQNVVADSGWQGQMP